VDIQSILLELKIERNRIDQAISALDGLASPSSPRRGRPPKSETVDASIRQEAAWYERSRAPAHLGSHEEALGDLARKIGSQA
jgi:hypothetical protein